MCIRDRRHTACLPWDDKDGYNGFSRYEYRPWLHYKSDKRKRSESDNIKRSCRKRQRWRGRKEDVYKRQIQSPVSKTVYHKRQYTIIDYNIISSCSQARWSDVRTFSGNYCLRLLLRKQKRSQPLRSKAAFLCGKIGYRRFLVRGCYNNISYVRRQGETAD